MKNFKWLALIAVGTSMACAGTTQNTQTTLASASSCSQLPDADATVQQLYTPGNVYAAKPVERKVFKARSAQPTRTFGASLYTHAEKGMTAPYMERVLRCHAAYGQAAHPNDPLHPAGGKITDLSVSSVAGNFAIRVEGDSTETGKEIWQRAEALSGQAAGVQTQQVSAAEKTHGAL